MLYSRKMYGDSAAKVDSKQLGGGGQEWVS